MVIKSHPIYDKYEFDSETGRYRMVGSIKWLNRTAEDGYVYCSVRSKKDKQQKTNKMHRFMWETFVGEIPDKMEIDHIDNVRNNNILSNLQCITKQQNLQRRNHDFLNKTRKTAHLKIKRAIKSIDMETGDTHVFKSKTACGRFVGCSSALVFLICEKKKWYKTFRHRYIFEYTDDEVNTIVPDKRLGVIRVSEEQKKENRAIYLKKRNDKNYIPAI